MDGMAEGNDSAVGKGGHGAWVGDGLGMGVRPSLYCFALFIHRCYNICEKSDDAAQDNLSEDEERLLQEWHVQASLMIPIVTQGQNWGDLWVHQGLAPRRWQSLELELLEQVVALGLCHHGASHLSSCASTTPSQGSNTSTLLPVILLVEDNEANVQTVSTYLEMWGYQCIIAGNGQEAIEVTQTQSPDLILMDIQMPGMDGLEAIQRIRQDPKFVDVPIIALTALAMAGDREKCLAAGATEYLAKPMSLKQLVTVIQQLLDASEPNA